VAALKTSDQIYYQIRWDPGIPEERVVIIYDDHQVGLRGVSFTEFTPGGRIPWSRLWRYELDGEVIWDRAQRIDRVAAVRQVSRKTTPEPGFTRLPLWRFEAERGEWTPWKGEGMALPEVCTVLSLNVLFDNHHPERLVTPRRTEALLALLSEVRPTLIALQEVKSELLHALLAEDWVRQGYTLSDGPAGDTVRPYGQLLLSRVPPDRLEQVRFSHSKRAIVAHFGALSVAVVHLTSDRGRDALARRQGQLERLCAGLTGDSLLVGDFNFGDEHTEPLLFDRVDLWPRLRPDEPGMTYDPPTNALAAVMSPTGRSRRLDRLMLRADPIRVLPTEITLIGTDPLPASDPPLFLSDHYGLSATLRMGAAQLALSASPTTHRSAAVICPPRSQWSAIQAIRRAHDPSFVRWIPHINLLYGFLPEPLFDAAATRLSAAITSLAPATLTLDRIGRFDHAGSTTLYLAPDRTSTRWLRALQHQLREALPQCVEQDRDGVFTPHLTLARCKPGEATVLAAALEAESLSVSFEADAITLLSRRGKAPFAARRTISLADGEIREASTPSGQGLAETLAEAGLAMTPGQRARREQAVAVLSEVIGGPVFTMGSARLAVDGPASDLDVLAVTRSAHDKVRQRVLDALGGRAVDAVVPVVKLEIEGIAVDLQLARYPTVLPLIDPVALSEAQHARLSTADARAAGGCLESAAILSAVAGREDDFRLALRMIRAWASARKIDAHALGYPGGISWAILLAATPPQPDASRWIEAMLSGLLEWRGAPLGMDLPVETSSPDPACILTTTAPRVNSVRNMIPTTLTVLLDEIARGLERVWEIRDGRRSWSALLAEVDPMGDPARIELSIEGPDRVACRGWLNGRILGLLIDLERRPGIPTRPYPAHGRMDACIGLLRAPEGEEHLKLAESVEAFIARFTGWSERPEGSVLQWRLVG
jgi:poly(A) polymerase